MKAKGLTISAAESCTGGLLSAALTDLPGSSNYFKGSIVAYDDGIKCSLLGLAKGLLTRYGAVSKETAFSMAFGAKRRFKTSIGVGITGIAGPSGETATKPVGLVYIALIAKNKRIVREFHFKGTRKMIRERSRDAALKLIIESVR